MTMKGVQLSPRINYLAMEDDEGPLGVMVFTGTEKKPRTVVTIMDQNDFRFWYGQFREAEDRGYLINQGAQNSEIGLSD